MSLQKLFHHSVCKGVWEGLKLRRRLNKEWVFWHVYYWFHWLCESDLHTLLRCTVHPSVSGPHFWVIQCDSCMCGKTGMSASYITFVAAWQYALQEWKWSRGELRTNEVMKEKEEAKLAERWVRTHTRILDLCQISPHTQSLVCM